MLPQAGIPCSRRTHEPTAEKIVPFSLSFRRLWFEPCLRQKERAQRAPSFWRKERDSNPRRLSPQRFSRPPRSTAPPSFRIGRLKWQPFFVVFRRFLAYSSAALAYKLRSQAAPHIQSTLLNGVPHAKLRSQAAPRFQSPFKRRSQRCAPRKKSAKVPAPECVPMTFPT